MEDPSNSTSLPAEKVVRFSLGTSVPTESTTGPRGWGLTFAWRADAGFDASSIPAISTSRVNKRVIQGLTALFVTTIASMTSHATLPVNRSRRYEEFSSTSTTKETREGQIVLDRFLRSALWEARDEVFEDGMSSRLSAKLDKHCRDRAATLAASLSSVVTSRSAPSEPTAAALRWLSELNDQESHATRLWLLEHALFSPDSTVRDSAVVGLQNLRDPTAVRSLETAAQREPIQLLRSEMQKARDELHSAQ